MKCKINVFMLNEHFSQEHADANHDGMPSENNRQYDWEDDLRITSDVIEVKEHHNSSYPLQGTLPDGTPFNHEVKNMLLFEIKSADQNSTFIGCSESMIDSYSNQLFEDTVELKIFIRDYEAYANPVPGIYIASREFPKALIFE